MTSNRQLPDLLSKTIKELLKIDNTIEEIWLFGSRANNTDKINSDWDIIVIAKDEYIKKLRCNHNKIHENIDVLVTFNKIEAIQPWMSKDNKNRWRRKRIKIKDWEFISSTEAV